VVEAIDSVGGPHGAFPSLHVGASAYACLFDWRRNRLRAMTYLPIVLMIIAATVILRYHYVVDLLAGLALAILAERLARRWQERWRSQSPLGSEFVAADAAP
jgi:membrane-associated phospholipid phosphatase